MDYETLSHFLSLVFAPKESDVRIDGLSEENDGKMKEAIFFGESVCCLLILLNRDGECCECLGTRDGLVMGNPEVFERRRLLWA